MASSTLLERRIRPGSSWSALVTPRFGTGVLESFEYVDADGRWYRVPESAETDLASIPNFLTWLVPRDGVYTPARYFRAEVRRIYADQRGCLVRLDNSAFAAHNITQATGGLRLWSSHPNYRSLHALALTAAIHEEVLEIRTENDIANGQEGEISWLAATFDQSWTE